MSLDYYLNLPNIIISILIVALIFAIIKIANLSKEKNNALTQSSVDKTNLENVTQNLDDSNHQLEEISQKLNISNDSLYKVTTDLELVKSDNQRLINNESELRNQIKESDNLQKALYDRINALTSENSRLIAKLDAQNELQEELKSRIETSYKALEERMKVMGNNLVKAGTEDLKIKSAENLGNVVNPLKEQLESFKKYLTDTQESNAKRTGELQNELERLGNAQKTLSKQAEDLTTALRSGGKTQGMWGELQLERVLDASGLSKGIEYQREVSVVNDEGKRGRPDVIINLPNNHCLIVDAKCSLTAYTNFISADDPIDKQRELKLHIQSLKSHIDELVKIDYSSFDSFNAPDFVFMFVPIDAALTDGLNSDPSLYDYASSKKVYLVSPSTLIPSLRVVSNLWVLSEQSDKMRELVKLAQNIKSKFDLVIDAYNAVDKAQTQMQTYLGSLKNRLFDGRGNLKSLVDRFDTNATRELQIEDGSLIDADTTVTRGVLSDN